MMPVCRVILVSVVALAFANQTLASCIFGGYFVLDQQGLTASDGGGSITVDTYRFEVTNFESNPATSIELDISGNFWAIPGINSTFRDSPALPQFLGSQLADSFFIGDGTQLVGASEDTTSRLYAAWTLPGITPIIAPGATETLAYLTVPTGEFPTLVAGRMAVDGSFIDIGGAGSSPFLDGYYVGPGSDLSEGLQGVFDTRDGGPIVLASAIVLESPCGHLEEFGEISASLVFATDEGAGFASGLVTDDNGDGVYDIMIDADWPSLPNGQLLTGEVLFESEVGDPNVIGFGFSITVPEPSTVALLCLALVGVASRRGHTLTFQ